MATAAPPRRRRPGPPPRRRRCRRRHGPGPPPHGRAPRGRPARCRRWRRSVLRRAVAERAHLDGQRRGDAQPPAPAERFVEVGGLDDREAADVLLALGERAVGGQDLAVLRAQRRGGARLVQAAREDPDALVAHLLVDGGDVLDDLLELIARGGGALGGLDDGEQVLLHDGPPGVAFPLSTRGGGPGRRSAESAARYPSPPSPPEPLPEWSWGGVVGVVAVTSPEPEPEPAWDPPGGVSASSPEPDPLRPPSPPASPEPD